MIMSGIRWKSEDLYQMLEISQRILLYPFLWSDKMCTNATKNSLIFLVS